MHLEIPINNKSKKYLPLGTTGRFLQWKFLFLMRILWMYSTNYFIKRYTNYILWKFGRCIQCVEYFSVNVVSVLKLTFKHYFMQNSLSPVTASRLVRKLKNLANKKMTMLDQTCFDGFSHALYVLHKLGAHNLCRFCRLPVPIFIRAAILAAKAVSECCCASTSI